MLALAALLAAPNSVNDGSIGAVEKDDNNMSDFNKDNRNLLNFFRTDGAKLLAMLSAAEAEKVQLVLSLSLSGTDPGREVATDLWYSLNSYFDSSFLH